MWQAVPLNPNDPRPLTQQLAADLRDRIRRKDLEAGQQLPTEGELSEMYDTSRTTVRQAVALLKTEGLLRSQQGRGTFVADEPPVRLASHRYKPAARKPGMGIWETTTSAQGLTGTSELLGVSIETADAELAGYLEIDEGDQVIVRRRRLDLNGEPSQLSDAYYPLKLFEGTEFTDSQLMLDGVSPHLERVGHKPVRASEEVTARTATADQAVVLRLPPGASILHVIRRTWDEHDTIVEVIFVIAHGHRNTFIYDDLPVY